MVHYRVHKGPSFYRARFDQCFEDDKSGFSMYGEGMNSDVRSIGLVVNQFRVGLMSSATPTHSVF
jgi:hypothetical protein